MAYPTTAQIAQDLMFSDRYWSGSTISFSFPTSGSQVLGYQPGSEPDSSHFAAVSSSQAPGIYAAMFAWDRLMGANFSQTASGGQINIAFSDVSSHGANLVGFTYDAPLNGGISEGGVTASGDIWLAYQQQGSDYAAGGLDNFKLMRGVAYAIGVKDPVGNGPELPAEYNNYRYTIMASQAESDDLWTRFSIGAGGGLEASRTHILPGGPMVFDIAAIQSRYGADPNTASGDTTYSFDQTVPTFMSIYDAGGNDTIDLSAHTRGSIIDLTPGAYSSIDHYSIEDQKAAAKALYPTYAAAIDNALDDKTFTWTNNVGIAFNTVIENVRAGSAADSILGNDANNNLSAGGGNDTVYGGVGADTIDGGDGQDFLRGDDGNDSITGGADFDDINGNKGNDTCYGGEGNDWVVGGQDQDLLFGENGNDVVYGNLGNDTISGGNGDDWVRGGQGDDVVDGGAGNDLIWGDRGNDTLTGGAGADMFHTFAGAGVDRVLDFNGGEGDRVVIDDHVDYTITASGGDTVITLTATGDTMVLQGVALASFSSGWVIAA